MIELKKKAIGGIKEMLEGRLAKRMAPPPQDQEDKQEGPETGPPDAEDRAEGHEMGSPPAEGSDADLRADLPEGADLSKLSPEEKQQLESLYAKMGC